MYSRNIIFLVDDTQALCALYAQALEEDGYQVTTAGSGAALINILHKDSFAPDLLILDMELPDMDGLDMLERLKSMGFNAPVIVIASRGSIHTAVEATRRGASDFLVKPFSTGRLHESVQRTLSAAGLVTKAGISAEGEDVVPRGDNMMARAAPMRAGFGSFIGISPPMQTVYDVIENTAKSNATVFITGESGTGKDICAEAIHRYSPRSHAPFVAINCAAIPRELLESELFGHVKGAFTGALNGREGAVAMARGGTLFLDEIAEMAADMQTKLLRFLQNLTYRKIGGNREEKANIRIVCATNRDPLEEVRSGRLRQDLYYRLHVIPIHMPPLRERKTDIIDLADHFLRRHAREERKSFQGFTQEAEKIMTGYAWPGNVRQLQNIVRSIVVLHPDGQAVTDSMLPPVLRTDAAPLIPRQTAQASGNMDDGSIPPLWKIERSAIERAIALCDGNIPKAGALLEISPSTIYRKKMTWDKHPGGTACAAF